MADQQQQKNKARKKNSPSRREKNKQRAEEWRSKNGMDATATTTTSDKSPPKKWHKWIQWVKGVSSPIEQESSHQKAHEQGRTSIEEKKATTPAPPNKLYADLEDAYRLSTLENPKTLSTALRVLVRELHPHGRTIAFPTSQMVDNIELQSKNIPSDTTELEELVRKTACRRGQVLDLEKEYVVFVRHHGREVFDPSQPWPKCYMRTHHP